MYELSVVHSRVLTDHDISRRTINLHTNVQLSLADLCVISISVLISESDNCFTSFISRINREKHVMSNSGGYALVELTTPVLVVLDLSGDILLLVKVNKRICNT